ncbi:adenylate/guanylate cyclase domain-containing protein [Viridibacillus arvi]|uniref:adenylate/guanylate cyclase domain-containing protein n=1 Tax=Viridibacillus arvi TaxID=263475 RepID=UPI0034CD01B9
MIQEAGAEKVNTFTKEDLEEISGKITEVLDTPMEVEDYVGDVVPSVDDLDDSNEGLLVECAILFVDIRGSTTLSDTSWAKSMAKIYRAFVRAMVLCVYKSGGHVRQIVGDRVMGVFVNDEEKKATEKALEAARAIVTTIDYYFNPRCRTKVNGKEIQCGVGIDFGKVLLTQVGMKAQEEEAKDLVWAGKIANMASKHTDLAEPGEIFITKRFYDGLPAYLKAGEMDWKSIIRLKGSSFFEGFVKQNFYLDCVIEDSNSESTVEITKDALSLNGSKDDLNTSDIINSIVQGTQKQTEKLLDRFESVVRREVVLEDREKKLQNKCKEVAIKEQNLLKKQESLELLKSSISSEIEFKKNQVEFNLRAEFLSNNLDTFKFEDTLEEIKNLISLGEKVGITALELKRRKLYYWRLVPYIKKYNLYLAFSLIEENLTEFPIDTVGMPWDSDIIDVVRRTNQKSEFYDLIKQNFKKFPPNASVLNRVRNILVQLGFQDRFESYEQRFIE